MKLKVILVRNNNLISKNNNNNMMKKINKLLFNKIKSRFNKINNLIIKILTNSKILMKLRFNYLIFLKINSSFKNF